MKVRDIMTSDVRCVTTQDSIQQAAQIMGEENIGSVPVEENNQLKGIITDRDIVLRNVAESKDPNQTVCGDIMSTETVTCSPDMELEEVTELMSRHQIRRIPVVENNHVVGIVALGDLAINEASDDGAGEALSDISCSDDQI